MYIKQAFKNKHDWWLYLAGLVLIVIAVILGQIPHRRFNSQSIAVRTRT